MKVIGIAGKAGSGKNTVAGLLAARLADLGYSVRVDSFARAIKEFLRGAFGWNGEKTPWARETMQRHGAVRRRQDPEFWTRRLEGNVVPGEEGRKPDFLIVCDVRFRNEADWIKYEMHGAIWCVSGRSAQLGSLGMDESEDLDWIDDMPNVREIPNYGSLSELAGAVARLVADPAPKEDAPDAGSETADGG